MKYELIVQWFLIVSFIRLLTRNLFQNYIYHSSSLRKMEDAFKCSPLYLEILGTIFFFFF